MKNEKLEKLEVRVDKIEGKNIKLESKVDTLVCSRDKLGKGKENQLNSENRMPE